MLKKIQLILPEIPKKKEYNAAVGCVVPLGLLSIASYLRKKIKDIEVEIIDGEIIGQRELEKKINADIVGISTNFFTYENAIKVAKIAKRKGAKVILGGIYASTIPELILKKHPEVDGVVIKDGELTFYQLVTEQKEISNFVYRKDKKIMHSLIIEPELDDFFPLDFELIQTKKYIQNYTEKIFNKRFLNIYSHKGCYWKNLCGGCKFCSIPKQKLRVVKPSILWKQINTLIKEYKLDGIIDYSDQFLQDEKWLNEFVKQAPKNPPSLIIFSRVNDITPKNVKRLSKLNCKAVLLGVESGSQKMLNNMKKGITVEQSINAVKLLAERDIFVNLFLVVGSPEENERSLNESLNLIKKLVKFGNVNLVELAEIVPFPGSPFFQDMIKIKKLRKKYMERDIMNSEELVNDFNKYFCNVSRKKIQEFIERVGKIVPNLIRKNLNKRLVQEK